ncbi:hypothetical protein BH23CHL2_BH23CHL2_10830 [soil metagenome]
MARQRQQSTPIASIEHADTRINIPTEELREFVADDEGAPGTMLYPRDPSLDPQLVWKGKDEQDREDLAVPVVPVYIQEKIHPRALIEDLRRNGGKDEATQLDLFADFDGEIDFDQMVDFYHHEQNWSNRMILGDSLLVMTSLAEKEGLRGKVQMIYVDPPYGIKFGSNWQVSTRQRSVGETRSEHVSRQPEQIKAFRDTWQLGIHSYLTYLRDRLAVARDLLTESGSIFVQIGDENVHLVRSLLDEIFGSDNYVSILSFVTTTSQTSQFVPCVTDFVLWYAKDRSQAKYRPLWEPKDIATAKQSSYAKFEVDGEVRNREPESGKSSLLVFDNLTSRSGSQATRQPIDFHGQSYAPRSGGWKTSQSGMERLALAGRIASKGRSVFYKRYFTDFPYTALSNIWFDTQMGGFGKETKTYVVQTNSRVIERCTLMTTDPGDLVIDPTCGSGTTAFTAEQWGPTVDHH